MNLAETFGFVFGKENTGEMGIPYSSSWPSSVDEQTGVAGELLAVV